MRKTLFIFSVIFSVINNSDAQVYLHDELDINNIKARFFSNGGLFYDVSPLGLLNGFEVPKGSGKSTMLEASLWVGGTDENAQLHFADGKRIQTINNYASGPLTIDGSSTCPQQQLYNRVWKINKTTIDSAISGLFSYSLPNEMYNWPAHGDTNIGQPFNIAPFVDVNGDGIYNPNDGDYPKIRGDQALFFIFNDKCNLAAEEGAENIGIEVQGMAYAFNCPQDSALNNTIFIHYDIINRGAFVLNNTYVGLFADMDIGFPTDDFIQCDVMRGSFFTYNGATVDGTGGIGEYGDHPPAQAVTFLAGPYQNADGLDNLIGIGQNESLNGSGFEDGITDNERLGLSNFIYFSNPGGNSGPLGPIYYNYLKSLKADSTPVLYGNYNYIPARYMFPGNSDQQYFWGTNGFPVPFWTEETAGDVPYDRRGLGSSGPFTFESGEVVPLDIAFVFGRDYHGNNIESIFVMKDRIDAIRAMFFADSTACGGSFSSVKSLIHNNKDIVVYPNPTKGKINITCSSLDENLTIEIYNLNGQLVFTELLNSNSDKNEIDLSALVQGFYFLKISSGKDNIHIQKIIKN